MFRILLAALCLAASLPLLAKPLPPTRLKVEYLSNPMGIDMPKPRFFFVPQHEDRGSVQAAYQILVSSDPSVRQADIWDSGTITSPDSIHIEYNGKPLQSNKSYYWKVRYTDGKGQTSDYSQVARFDTGLLNAADWKAKWIRGGNVMRKEFSLPAAPVRARAFVAGLGYYELRLNGKKVGQNVLDSPYTPYDKRVLYSVYDVTGMLKQGANAVGVMLGEGWYKGRTAIVQIEVEMAGGQKQTIATDTTWKATQGPILSDSVYDGETYDARKELPGWDNTGYSDTAWTAANTDNPPKGVLSAQLMPAIQVTGTIKAISLSSPKPGVWVYDLGQNFSGWVRLKVRGAAGTKVRIRHAELLYEDGTLNVENLRAARATDFYTLKGTDEGEEYEPRFTYHGFRYVELTGYPGVPRMDSVEARVVHSNVAPSGGWASSKPLLNQLQRIILWGTTSNLHSVPTDCNQRDERMGWMADAHLAAETAIYNFDMAAFYSHFIRSMRDSQEDDGSVPDTVPRAAFARGAADPAWGAAYPLMVEYMYHHYGDKRIVEENYQGLKRWTDYLTTHAQEGIMHFHKFGDWVPIQQTPGYLVSTVYYYVASTRTAWAADMLGNKADADKYNAMSKYIAEQFHKKYWVADLNHYQSSTQAAQILPLFYDMVPKAVRGGPMTRLRHDVLYEQNTHLTTGILATKHLFPVLSTNGNLDLAYDVATQTTYPSFGYMLSKGATTIWELWQEKTGPSMNSHNHPMFGSVGAWMYEFLGGLRMAPNTHGYQKLTLIPGATRDLQWVTATTDTVRGPLVSAWQRSPGRFRYEVEIPVGVTAEVTLPKGTLQNVEVREGASTLWQGDAFQAAPGVTAGRMQGNNVVLSVGSGRYVFELSGE